MNVKPDGTQSNYWTLTSSVHTWN